ncbi:Uncharacterised protein [Klebsiella pneumoniae]|nr:Uncharacterised protein [Klebsiella pneumoniae]
MAAHSMVCVSTQPARQARITLNAVNATSLSIYFKDTAGVFRYTIDGGIPVVVTGAGTGNVTKVDVTGLSSTGTHSAGH